MDEGAPRAAVAVDEGVDRLEVGVGDGGLGQGRQIRAAGEGEEVLQRFGHPFVPGRNEERARGGELGSADPHGLAAQRQTSWT